MKAKSSLKIPMREVEERNSCSIRGRNLVVYHFQKARVIPSGAQPAPAGVAESRNLAIYAERSLRDSSTAFRSLRSLHFARNDTRFFQSETLPVNAHPCASANER